MCVPHSVCMGAASVWQCWNPAGFLQHLTDAGPTHVHDHLVALVPASLPACLPARPSPLPVQIVEAVSNIRDTWDGPAEVDQPLYNSNPNFIAVPSGETRTGWQADSGRRGNGSLQLAAREVIHCWKAHHPDSHGQTSAHATAALQPSPTLFPGPHHGLSKAHRHLASSVKFDAPAPLFAALCRATTITTRQHQPGAH